MSPAKANSARIVYAPFQWRTCGGQLKGKDGPGLPFLAHSRGFHHLFFLKIRGVPPCAARTLEELTVLARWLAHLNGNFKRCCLWSAKKHFHSLCMDYILQTDSLIWSMKHFSKLEVYPLKSIAQSCSGRPQGREYWWHIMFLSPIHCLLIFPTILERELHIFTWIASLRTVCRSNNSKNGLCW